MEQLFASRASIVHWYSIAGRRGGMDSWELNRDFIVTHIYAGVTPMITWEFWNGRNDGTNPFPLVDIASGQFDAYIDSWAQGIAALSPGGVYLRPFHEMNDAYRPSEGHGYPWSVVPDNYFGNRPADLVAAWRHIHDRFMRAGATNVRWIFNADGDIQWQPIPAGTYPGDDVVDFIGWDAYEGNASTVQEDYDYMNAFNSAKPMLLGEVGATSAPFVHTLFDGLSSGRMSRISALVWWDEDPYLLDDNPDLAEAFWSLVRLSGSSSSAASSNNAASAAKRVPRSVPKPAPRH